MVKQKILNYINGKLVEPSSSEYLDNINPATGQVYSILPSSTEKDVNDAVKAAKESFEKWGNLSISKRSEFLNQIAESIENKLTELAKAESIDTGKPISLAESVDIPRSAANFRFFASLIDHVNTESYPTKSTFDFAITQPLGVVGTISPWNLPLYLLSWKIAPALAAGNTVVAKPSEITPMTAFLLSKICKDINLPKGTLNIIHGLGNIAGDALVRHPDIKAISFTGSTATGKKIAISAAPNFKKLSLEMGGKNPTIIFSDANYEKMLETTIRSAFSNQGEICFCGERIYVEDKLYKKFKNDFVSKVKNLKIGNPLDGDTKIGAIVSETHFEKILNYYSLAEEEGGEILCGGKSIQLSEENEGGYFVEPTIIEGLDYTCKTNQEEVFGPIATLTPFSSEQEVIKYANSTVYGLSAVLWTENLSRAYRIVNELNAGIIWVNCWMSRNLNTPFGGMKNSGIGREGGEHALRFFTETKNVTIKFQDDYRYSYKI